MVAKPQRPNIQTRRELFDFLQGQMQTAYSHLIEKRRLPFENTLLKTYLLEVNLPDEAQGVTPQDPVFLEFLGSAFSLPEKMRSHTGIEQKEEEGFFELTLTTAETNLTLFIDTVTNPRFWQAYSTSSSSGLNRWLDHVVLHRPSLDYIWLWPDFLEKIQARGEPRGFGLDYDYRHFEQPDSDVDTYLKMQLWGGPETQSLYKLLKDDRQFGDKIVLSKIRMKETLDIEAQGLFALQDIKYTGKSTVRGTDFNTHLATLRSIRDNYESEISTIEALYALRWKEHEIGRSVFEGYAIHFIPDKFTIPIEHFFDRTLDGSLPFRLLGIRTHSSEFLIAAEVVDMHTGGEFAIELRPDLITMYLPEGTCGNTVARLYANLQHSYKASFSVEADNGDTIF